MLYLYAEDGRIQPPRFQVCMARPTPTPSESGEAALVAPYQHAQFGASLPTAKETPQ